MELDKRKSTVQGMMKKEKKGIKGDSDYWPILKENYDLGLDLRRPFDQRWQINLSFLAGRQYVFYNRSAELLQQIMMRKGRLRIVDNKLLPRFQKQVSRMIRNQPIMSVVPSTTEQEDIEAAKIGDKVLKHFWRQNQLRKKIRELSGWIYGCGNGFLDDRWNSRKGPTKINEETGELEYLGDADCGVWSPFEVIVPASELGSTSLHEQPWMMKAKYRPLEWIQANYKRGSEVKAEERPLPFMDTTAITGYSPSGVVGKVEGAVLKELYIQPNGKFPKGLFLVGTNGVILEKNDYPLDFYHLEQFKDIEIPGVFWGLATTEAAIWLQKIQNRTLSDVVEFNRTTARGKFLVPRGSKMEVELDDSHGQKLLYTPVLGHKPEWMDLKTLPTSYNMALQIVAQGLMELYHQHEVTEGTNKSDIRSGEMVQLLLEQDDYGNIPTHAVFEESLESVMQRVLRRIQKGYDTERVLKVEGRDGEFEVFSFKNSDLRNNTDVHVKKESSLPDSRVGRQAQILNRYEKGLYGNPQDPEVRRHVMNMLDDAVVKDIYGDVHLDEQNAKIENRAMMGQPGTVIMINLYDNHSVHMMEHRRFRKTKEYQDVKFKDVKGFQILESGFETHEKQHMAMLEEEVKRRAQNLRVLEGGKGGKG